MHSRLYVGQVRHTRFVPRYHAFRYRVFQFYLDLDELPTLMRRLPLCSAQRPAPVRFDRKEHLGDATTDLKSAVLQRVREMGGDAAISNVRLLTNLRYFGIGFNPVSFYYCFDRSEQLRYILAEVNNTPWGERHCYLIPASDRRSAAIRHSTPKAFHVSPFMDLDMDYRWQISEPDDRLHIHIENRKADQRLFDASLVLRSQALTAANLLRNLATYPFMTAKVVAAIYYEAARLWLKRIPYVPHPKPQEAPLAANKRQ